LKRILAAGLAVLGLAALSCIYKPEVPDGVVRCDEHQRCPAGYICNATRNGAVVALVCCRTIGCEDRFGTGAPPPDAAVAADADGAAADGQAD
jgi:hypothetical protein